MTAKLTLNTRTIGKMSPFCTLKFNNKKLVTDVQKNAHKRPKWFEEYMLDIYDIKSDIEIRVWDKKITKSDPIGFCKIRVSSLAYNGGLEQDFDIYYQNKVTGHLSIESLFHDGDGTQLKDCHLHFQNQH